MIMDDLTQLVIGCAYEVHNTLGSGFLEKIYENSLVRELRLHGLSVQQQAPVSVQYKGAKVGEYSVDILVEKQLVCELKAVSSILPTHQVQLLNYLVATGIDDGLLINFSKSVEVKRKYRLFSNQSCKSC